MRLRMLGGVTLALAVVGGITPLTAAQAATVPHVTPGNSPTEFYAASGRGFEIGGGATIDNTTPTVSVSADLETVTASASGWQLSLTSSTALTTGSYTTGIAATQNGVTCSSGSFTILEISATDVNATFSLDCGTADATPGAVGFIRYNATLATPVPTLPTSSVAITDPPHSGTTSANPTEFSFKGSSGDWVSAGQNVDLVGSSNVIVSGNQTFLTVNAGDWSLVLSAPQGQVLVPGTYNGATRAEFNTGTSAGIDLTGQSRGCNQDFGTVTIYEISSSATGTISSLNAVFSQTCESTTAAPLVGFVRINATQATPIPTFLTAPVKATSGAAESDGETDVTLDASGSNATAGASYSFDFGDGTTPTVSSGPVLTKPEWEGTYKVVVTITDAGQTIASTAQWLTVGDGYHAVTPQRILDTRKASQIGSYTGPIAAGGTVTLSLPSSVTAGGHGPLEAVVLNVTVTGATAGGNIMAYSSGLSSIPTTSNVNFGKGQTVANLVTVALMPGGQVILKVTENPGSVQLIADVEGYYTSGNDATNAGFAALSPTRLIDTRSKTGGVGGRLAAYAHVRYTLPSSVPAGASAVALNVTAVGTSSFGDLKVYPDSATIPNVSNLNFAKGGTVPNLVIIPIPANRVIDFYLDSNGSADLLADLEGYFSVSAPAKFVPAFPTRLFDTRTNFLPGPVPAYSGLVTSMSWLFQVPNTALKAALYNVTVTQPQSGGNIIVFPNTATTVPSTSNVNFGKGQTVANSAIGTMSDGKEVFLNDSAGSTQLIADFFGYYALPLATTAPPTDAVAAHTAGKFPTTPSTHILTKTQFLGQK